VLFLFHEANPLVLRNSLTLTGAKQVGHHTMNPEVVDIAQLLGRREVNLSDPGVREYISGKVVLVTGAGGSIGSELCRQISELGPKCLIMLGRGENSIYQIHNELMASSIGFPCVCVIANVCDKNRIDAIVGRYLPEVVFHAAAHKHVPYMESDPEEAVINNVFGSRNMCEISKKYGVKTFVLISTDKAVALSSVMGATKRLAELIVQKESTDSDTRFVTVRFGNVLGSRGSVVPLFEKQIRSGGPVTVTHQKMNRYFMSIPEAVRLVLHSGNCANNGELCVLDMGKPVPIVDLAENMISMFGKKPYEDIDIVFTGLRPGEVLSEELFTQEELKVTRTIDKINICQPVPNHIPDGCWSKLYAAASTQDKDGTIEIISDLLPGFKRK
jgi:FlaA1/EpsC-like NDP-sugar epimerase